MTRRDFGALLPVAAFQTGKNGPELSTLPNYCSHEHWGSIDRAVLQRFDGLRW